MEIRLVLSKYSTNFEYALRQDKDSIWKPTVDKCVFKLRRYTATIETSSLFDRTLTTAGGGVLTFPVLRTQCQSYFLPANQPVFNMQMIATKKPQVLSVQFVPHEFVNPTDKAADLHQLWDGRRMNPLSFSFTTVKIGNEEKVKAADLQAISPRVLEMQVYIGGVKYPQERKITRDGKGWEMSGGTAVEDYKVYETLTRQLAYSDGLGVQPLLSFHDYTCGAFSLFMINLMNSDETLQDHKPPVDISGSLEIRGKFYAGSTFNYAAVVTAFYNDFVQVVPEEGRAEAQW